MITLQEFQIILAESLLGGSTDIAGILIYTAVLGFVFVVLAKKAFAAFALMIPITFVFTTMGILTDSMTILLIFVAVLGLGVTSRNLAGRLRCLQSWAAEAGIPSSTLKA